MHNRELILALPIIDSGTLSMSFLRHCADSGRKIFNAWFMLWDSQVRYIAVDAVANNSVTLLSCVSWCCCVEYHPNTFHHLVSEIGIDSNRLCDIYHTAHEIHFQVFWHNSALIDMNTYVPFFERCGQAMQEYGSPYNNEELVGIFDGKCQLKSF